MNADNPPAAARRWQKRSAGIASPIADIWWFASAPVLAIAVAAAASLPLWPPAILAIVATSAVLAAFRQQPGFGEQPGFRERTPLRQQAAGSSFGLANGVTLLRVNLTVVVVVACIAALPTTGVEPRLAWAIFVTAALALLMDGIDGWLARRRRETSHFGGRFDMIADTAFTITLAFTLVAFELAGAWVLAIGLMRPLFLLLGRWRPVLRTPLPPCRLRKVLCALSLSLMVAALAPPLAGIAPLLAAAALATLVLSFARDLRHLMERRQLA